MKQYPTIPKKPTGRATVFWVFDKLDGSNIRVEWTKKRGFYKFGSRKRLLGTDQGILSKAEALARAIEEKFAYTLGTEAKLERVTCFFEFHGPNSFAGTHNLSDKHRLTIIDAFVHKKGMMTPEEYTEAFYNGQFDVPTFLGKHTVDETFRRNVQDGNIPGVTFEGAVCKAKPDRKWEKPNMFKIKSRLWIEKVKATHDSSKWDELL